MVAQTRNSLVGMKSASADTQTNGIPETLVHFMLEAHIDPKNHADDPGLSTKGKAECEKFAKSFKDAKYLTHIFVSPLKASVETAVLCFGDILRNGDRKGVQLIILPELHWEEDMDDNIKKGEELKDVYNRTVSIARLKPTNMRAKKGTTRMRNLLKHVRSLTNPEGSMEKYTPTEVMIIVNKDKDEHELPGLMEILQEDDDVEKDEVYTYEMFGEKTFKPASDERVKEIRQLQKLMNNEKIVETVVVEEEVAVHPTDAELSTSNEREDNKKKRPSPKKLTKADQLENAKIEKDMKKLLKKMEKLTGK